MGLIKIEKDLHQCYPSDNLLLGANSSPQSNPSSMHDASLGAVNLSNLSLQRIKFGPSLPHFSDLCVTHKI